MNALHIGFTKDIPFPPGGFLLIDDEVVDIPRTRVFDPMLHSFNPLKDIDYKKAREIAEVLYAIYPQGENTLTVRNGRRALLKELLREVRGKRVVKRFDYIKGDEEVRGVTEDILSSPVLRRVLCNKSKVTFSFNPRYVTQARINRAELGEFDALVLGLLLMTHFKGQVVVPDFGFYGRDAHVSLIREGRLIAGVNFLEELPEKLRQAALLIEDKEASGATHEDAVELAKYECEFQPGTNEYNAFIDRVMP